MLGECMRPCMLDGNVHSWWMGACLVDGCVLGG